MPRHYCKPIIIKYISNIRIIKKKTLGYIFSYESFIANVVIKSDLFSDFILDIYKLNIRLACKCLNILNPTISPFTI